MGIDVATYIWGESFTVKLFRIVIRQSIGDKVLSSDALLRNLELCYYDRDHLVICMVEISLFPLDLREFKL